MQASTLVMLTVGSSIPMWLAPKKQAEQSIEPRVVWSWSCVSPTWLIAIKEYKMPTAITPTIGLM